MANRLVVLCAICLFGTPVAADDDGRAKCLASPNYSCLIMYALATAQRIERAPGKTWTLGAIAAEQARAGDPKGGLATAEKIERASAKAVALAGIAAALAKRE